MPNATISVSVDDYINSFPREIKVKLRELYDTIQSAIPEARATIKYAIPTFVLGANIISFGAWKNHIGVYPVPRGVAEFEKELAAYAGNKGTLQLPYNEPIPKPLITRIVLHNLTKARQASTKKSR